MKALFLYALLSVCWITAVVNSDAIVDPGAPPASDTSSCESDSSSTGDTVPPVPDSSCESSDESLPPPSPSSSQSSSDESSSPPSSSSSQSSSDESSSPPSSSSSQSSSDESSQSSSHSSSSESSHSSSSESSEPIPPEFIPPARAFGSHKSAKPSKLHELSKSPEPVASASKPHVKGVAKRDLASLLGKQRHASGKPSAPQQQKNSKKMRPAHD